MQIVEPIDIEDALRIDLAEFLPDYAFVASPVDESLSAGTVGITSFGGYDVNEVADGYDLSIDCWGKTFGDASRIANKVAGIIGSLPLRKPSSNRDYKDATKGCPYRNPDPSRPLLPRYTFTATVILRGKPIF